MESWFDDVPVLGAMPDDLAAAKLAEIGEFEPVIETTPSGRPAEFGMPWTRTPPYRYSGHVFGHVGELAGPDPVPVRSVAELDPDLSLRSTPLRIALGKLGIVRYPGSGNHMVLFDFAARHYSDEETQSLHYNVVARVTEGQRAGVLNVPIFLGLNPGDDGVALRGFTVNVKNEKDEAMLSFLESDAVRGGLKLLQAAQPALAPLSEIAYGLTKSLANRNRNVPVQNFNLGLDFAPGPYGAVLRTGAYVAMQVPAELQYTWDWDGWVYHPKAAEIISRSEPRRGLPYNHVVFTVTRQSHG